MENVKIFFSNKRLKLLTKEKKYGKMIFGQERFRGFLCGPCDKTMSQKINFFHILEEQSLWQT